jgi:two-component system, cell cycle response regulator
MADNLKEISEGIFWLGSDTKRFELRYHAYLLDFREGFVLIDPPPAPYFDKFWQSVGSIIKNQKISHIIFQNFSPAVSTVIPLLMQETDATFVFHHHTKNWLSAFEISNPVVFVGDALLKLSFESGQELNFIETPYLPALHSFISYLPSPGILFSSLLFSANTLKWNLIADNVFYPESMKSFHELYLPDRKFLSIILDIISNIKNNKGITAIASAHGSIINDHIEKYIFILKSIECGIAINPIGNDLTRKEGYIMLCNRIIDEYKTVFSRSEIIDVFKESNIYLDPEKLEIQEFSGSGEELWEQLFSIIYLSKGLRWLSLVVNTVLKFAKAYNVVRPKVFNEKEQELIKIDNENIRLKVELKEQETNFEKTTESLTKDTLTKLYNETFLNLFLQNVVNSEVNKNQDFHLLLLEIDNLWKLKKKHGKRGKEKSQQTILILARMLQINIESLKYQLFKMVSEGAFMLYIPEETLDTVIYFTEKIRNEVSGSSVFQDNISISCGIVSKNELPEELVTSGNLLKTAEARLDIARNLGQNQICHQSDTQLITRKTILLIDNDPLTCKLIQAVLTNAEYNIVSCFDGFEASKIIEKEHPVLVISELMIPKDSGLVVRERMLMQTKFQNIPFILVSHLKDDSTINLAYQLKVSHFLQKPLHSGELKGIVDNILQK